MIRLSKVIKPTKQLNSKHCNITTYENSYDQEPFMTFLFMFLNCLSVEVCTVRNRLFHFAVCIAVQVLIMLTIRVRFPGGQSGPQLLPYRVFFISTFNFSHFEPYLLLIILILLYFCFVFTHFVFAFSFTDVCQKITCAWGTIDYSRRTW